MNVCNLATIIASFEVGWGAWLERLGASQLRHPCKLSRTIIVEPNQCMTKILAITMAVQTMSSSTTLFWVREHSSDIYGESTRPTYQFTTRRSCQEPNVVTGKWPVPASSLQLCWRLEKLSIFMLHAENLFIASILRSNGLTWAVSQH